MPPNLLDEMCEMGLTEGQRAAAEVLTPTGVADIGRRVIGYLKLARTAAGPDDRERFRSENAVAVRDRFGDDAEAFFLDRLKDIDKFSPTTQGRRGR